MRVQEDLGVFVPDSDCVVVADLCPKSVSKVSLGFERRVCEITLAVHQKLVALQTLLEGRAHERVAGSRLREDRKVDPEEGEIDNEGDKDEANGACHELAIEYILGLWVRMHQGNKVKLGVRGKGSCGSRGYPRGR